MKTRKWAAINSKGQSFIIDEDSKVGFYLYVYEDVKCIRDYLQDGFKQVKAFALKYFNVPETYWAETE